MVCTLINDNLVVTRVQSQSIQERERLIEEMEVEVEREETEATARQRETAMMAQEWHQQVWCTCSHADKAHEHKFCITYIIML